MATKTSDRRDYEAHKGKAAARQAEQSAKGRDIGSIPAIVNIRRRSKCLASLKSFCDIYNPEGFTLEWSQNQLREIAKIEEAVKAGALFAFADPRGDGKTTRVRMAALWAMSYALRRYTFVIGANSPKAEDTLDALKMYVRFLPTYAEDFPEIVTAVRHLAGIAQKAGGQHCGGVPTMIEWSKERIILPTVPCPPNWPKRWPRRKDGMAPTSGVIVGVSGLTGEGIRGSLLTLTTGESVRPDFVLLDDPQTPESARSPSQNETRMQLVSADVLGMAGPGKTIAAVMPCTVIARGDFVDKILDRSKHPLWRGERTKLLKSMPTNLAAWDDYFEVYRRCAQLEPPDYSEASALYTARRDELDEGAEASWEARKLPAEVSAIQHAMHLYCRDPRSFMAEYQNDPVPDGPAAAALALTPEEVLAKASNLPRRIVPRGCTRLTAFIDVGAHLLWYMVCAWDERFGGHVIDYGPYPEQRRNYFSKNDPRPSLSEVPGYVGQPQEVSIYGGLSALTSQILGKGYPQEETSSEVRVERCLMDANWGPGTDLVYEFCRRSTAHSGILLPSHGKFIGASSNPMASWQVKPGERSGLGWRLAPATGKRGRHVIFDTNQWKSFAAERIRTGEGAPGCVRLFAPEAGKFDHALLADHFGAEYPVAVSAKGERVVDEWKDRPGRDNDFWDCFVGCAVAASVAGLTFTASGQPASQRPQSSGGGRMKFSEMQRRKRELED